MKSPSKKPRPPVLQVPMDSSGGQETGASSEEAKEPAKSH